MRTNRLTLPPSAALAIGLAIGAAVGSSPWGVHGAVPGIVVALAVVAVGTGLVLRHRSRAAITLVTVLVAAAGGLVRGAAAEPGAAPPGLEAGPGTLDVRIDRAGLRSPAGPGATSWFEGRPVGATSGRAVGPPLRVAIPVATRRRRIATGSRPHGDGSPPSVPLPGELVRVTFGTIRSLSAEPGQRPRLIAHAAGGNGVVVLAAPDTPAQRLLYTAARVRRTVRDRLDAAVTDRRASALLSCLLIGDADSVSPTSRAAFRRAGLAHLLSVSGLHVVLLASVVQRALLGVLAPLSPRARNAATAGVLVPSLAAYALLCGLALPVVRASIFLAVALIARCVGRRTGTADHLAVAAIVLIAANPAESRSPGFLLSFGAVCGLAWLTPRFEEALFPGLRMMREFPESFSRLRRSTSTTVARSVAAALAAHVGAAPVVAAFFGETHVIGPAVNVPAVLVTALVLPAAGVCAMAGAWLPSPVGWAVAQTARLLEWIAVAAADVPFATLTTGEPPLTCVVLAVALIVLGALHRRWTPRDLLYPFGALCLLAIGPQLSAGAEPVGLTALPVGHGQAVLLRAAGTAVLVDAGGRLPGAASQRVIRSLRSERVRHLNALVLSHEDSDHCGAVTEVLGYATVDLALVPSGFGGDPAAELALKSLRRAGVTIRRVGRGDVVELPSIALRVLHPRSDHPGPVGNHGSLVIHATLEVPTGTLNALLPGDVEGTSLESIARDPTLMAADVLVLPHHGRGPADPQRRLINRTGARHVIASAANAAHVTLRDVFVTGRDGRIHVDHRGLTTSR